MKRVIACIVCSAVFFAVSCSYENTATVTIDTGIRKQAQINWFDRVLAFLSLSQPLQADPVPGGLPYTVNKIILTITAPDMETIQQEIPIDTGKITLEIPAGSQRSFEIVAGELVGAGAPTFTKYYGGITTVDLSPGQQVNLNIEMGKLPIIDVFSNANPSFSCQINEIMYDVRAVKIYDQNKELLFVFGPSAFNVEYYNDGIYQQTIIHVNLSTPLTNGDYYVSVVNKYGEGELRDFQI